MKNGIVETLFFLICCTRVVSGGPLDASFTYQGRLIESGHPATGIYEMRFTLFDAPTSGNQVGQTISLTSVPVSNGLFTTQLDFGSGAFDSASRWLEIMVNLRGTPSGYHDDAVRIACCQCRRADELRRHAAGHHGQWSTCSEA